MMIVNDAISMSVTLELSIILLELSISCQLCFYNTGHKNGILDQPMACTINVS